MEESKRRPKHDPIESRRDKSIHNAAYKVGDVKGKPVSETQPPPTSQKKE